MSTSVQHWQILDMHVVRGQTRRVFRLVPPTANLERCLNRHWTLNFVDITACLEVEYIRHIDQRICMPQRCRALDMGSFYY